MHYRLVWVLTAVVLFVGLSGCNMLSGHGSGGGRSKQESEVTLDQVPAAVKATILKEAGDQQVTEVEEITTGDVVTYEAEWVLGDDEVEITVAADGKLLGKETEPADDDDEDDEDEDDDD